MGEAEEHLNITVEPLMDESTGLHYNLVTFESMDVKASSSSKIDEMDLGQASSEYLQSLQDELRYTKENLQATIEELETSNEEMQATNEELVASNEELQSTNEELHSVNEELYTVNAEYQRKIAELEQMTSDMDSLLQSTEIGVMFLDRDLCIRKFTSRIGQFFDLLPQDVGRRISTFAHNSVHDGLMRDIQMLLETQEICQREVQDVRGTWYLLRVLPYLGKGQAGGVVITVVDVSGLKQTESQLRRMSKVFMDGADPIIIEDLNARILDVNHESVRIYGSKREELVGQSMDLLVPPARREASRRLRARCREQDHVRNIETVRQTKSGEKLPVLLTLSLLTEEDGKPVAIASIAKDIKRLKDAEREAREAVRRLGRRRRAAECVVDPDALADLRKKVAAYSEPVAPHPTYGSAAKSPASSHSNRAAVRFVWKQHPTGTAARQRSQPVAFGRFFATRALRLRGQTKHGSLETTFGLLARPQ